MPWRPWYQNSNQELFLLIPPNRLGFSNNESIVHMLLHNGTHLYHMHITDVSKKVFSQISYVLMESIAMLYIASVLKLIEKGYEIESELGKSFNTKTIRAFLAYGLLERAVRVLYDYDIHFGGIELDKWLTNIRQNQGLNLPFYRFATEFHGLPGLPMSYMLGLNTFLLSENKKEIFLGNSELFKTEYIKNLK